MFKKLRRDREYIRRTQIKLPEMKATLSEMKNISEGINNQSRLQKKISKLQNNSRHYPKEKTQRKKKFKNEQITGELWDSFSQLNLW